MLALMAMVMFSSVVMAKKYGGEGGFIGPQVQFSVVNVEQAKKMNDEDRVALRGYIVSSLGDEKYVFKDNTGSIQVEIDRKKWNGLTVTPDSLVEIKGELDTHRRREPDIDVDSISLVSEEADAR